MVNQCARRSLRENTCDPTDRERKPDAFLVPPPVAGNINREEWSDSRLDVLEEKIQPV